MTFHGPDIQTIKQPVYLLAIKGEQLVLRFRPDEFIFFQAFVIQHKTVVLPKQAFNFGASFIGKRVQVSGKRIMTQLTFNNGRDPSKIFRKSIGCG